MKLFCSHPPSIYLPKPTTHALLNFHALSSHRSIIKARRQQSTTVPRQTVDSIQLTSHNQRDSRVRKKRTRHAGTTKEITTRQDKARKRDKGEKRKSTISQQQHQHKPLNPPGHRLMMMMMMMMTIDSPSSLRAQSPLLLLALACFSSPCS